MKTKILIFFSGIIIGIVGTIVLQDIPRDLTYTAPAGFKNAKIISAYSNIFFKNVRAKALGPLNIIVPAKNDLNIAAAIAMRYKQVYPVYFVYDNGKNKVANKFTISDSIGHMCDMTDKNGYGVFDFMNIGGDNMTINLGLMANGLDGNFIGTAFVNPREEITINFNNTWYKVVKHDTTLGLQETKEKLDKNHGMKIFIGVPSVSGVYLSESAKK